MTTYSKTLRTVGSPVQSCPTDRMSTGGIGSENSGNIAIPSLDNRHSRYFGSTIGIGSFRLESFKLNLGKLKMVLPNFKVFGRFGWGILTFVLGVFLGGYMLSSETMAQSSGSSSMPVLTIETEYRASGDTRAKFFILADPAPTAELDVNYNAAYASTAGLPGLTSVGFATKLEAGSYMVPIEVDIENGTNTILQSVTLTASSGYTLGTPATRQLPPSATLATPQITITSSTESVVEGTSITFDVEAFPGAEGDTEVVVHVTQGSGQDFIAEQLTSGRLEKMVTFTNTTFQRSFSVMTKVDGDNSLDGEITATIQPSPSMLFVLGSVTNSKSVDIIDNGLPVLSVKNAADASESGLLNFPVESSKRIAGGLTVRYTPMAGTGNFLADSIEGELASTELYFYRNRASEPYTAMLSIPIVDDSVNEENGTVSVRLEPDTAPLNYTVKSTENVATGNVLDDEIPILSIVDGPPTTDSGFAVFVVTSSIETSDLMISYTPSEVLGGDFLTDEKAQRTTGTFEFEQTNGTGPFSTNILVQLDDDDTDEPHGQIQVTLNKMSDPTQYDVDQTAASAKIDVIDSDIPMLDISATDTSVAEDQTAEFKVVSNIRPHRPIRVNYKAQTDKPNVGNSYLRDEPTFGSELLTFTADDSGNFEATLQVDLDNDETFDPAASVYVFIENDPVRPNTYSPTTNARIEGASVAILDNDLPILSIRPNFDQVEESESASFTITAHKPRLDSGTLNLLYTPSEVSGGDFLVDANEQQTTGPSWGFYHTSDKSSADLDEIMNSTYFYRNDDGVSFSANLIVPLDDDTDREHSGEIKVTINPSSSYTVSTTNSSATVRVDDNDSPVLSVATIQTTYAESAPVSLKIVSDRLPTSSMNKIQVSYTLKDLTGNFVGSVAGVERSNELTFSDTAGVISSTLTLPNLGDEIREIDGKIEFSLFPDMVGELDYVLASQDISAEITITDDDKDMDSTLPELWVKASGDPVLESGEAIFEIASDIAVANSLTVSYTATNLEGNFLGVRSGTSQTADLTFAAQGQIFVANLPVTLDNDVIPENTGSIKITLEDSTDYTTIGGASKSVVIWDNDLPELSITAPSTANENAAISFTVTSSYNPGKDLDVAYTPVNVAGDFLATASGVASSQLLSFTEDMNDVYTASLIITPNNDTIDEVNGSIMVTLNPDSNGTVDYLVAQELSISGNSTAVVEVVDDDIPVLSIAANLTALEYDPAIPIVANMAISRTIKVGYTATNTSQSFLDPNVSGSLHYAQLNFATTPDNAVVAELNLPVKIDVANTLNGSISVVLNARSDNTVDFDNDRTVDYMVDPMLHTATVEIKDGNVPQIWLTAPESILENGNLAITVNSSDVPNSAMTVKYTPEDILGNYLDIDTGVPASTVLDFGSNDSISFNIPLDDNEIVEQDGSIRVSLDANPEHYRFESGGFSSVTVKIINDDFPELSVNPGGVNVRENEQINVSVISDKLPFGPMVIRYKLKNKDGNFLGTESNAINRQLATFYEFNDIVSADIPVGFDDDDVKEIPGSVTFTLIDSSDYSVNTSRDTQTITVLDNDSAEISIEDATQSAEEGTSASFKVIARNIPDSGDLLVQYMPTDEVGSFLGPVAGIPRTTRLFFTYDSKTSTYSANLSMEIPDNVVDEANGWVKVRLSNDPEGGLDYFVSVGLESALVEVTDNDIPVISISNAPDVAEDGTAKFVLTSDIQPQPLDIRYTPSEVDTGDFIVDSDEAITTENNVTFSQTNDTGPFLAPLNITLDDDDADEADGSIRVLLNIDGSNPVRYMVDATANTAFANVSDDDVPVLSVVGDPNFSSTTDFKSETELVDFTVKSTILPHASLRVDYYQSSLSNFLGSQFNQYKTKLLTFSEVSGEYVATVPVQLVATDSPATEGTVQLKLLSDANAPANYTLSETVAETIGQFKVIHDTPVLSISEISYYSEADAAIFRIHSDVKPPAGLIVRYTPEEVGGGSFLPSHNSLPLSSPALNFEPSTNGDDYVATLVVSIDNDNVDEAHGSILVTLKEDNNMPVKYKVSSAAPSASSVVKDNDTPVLIISDAPNVSEDSGPAQFVITATTQPYGPLTVNYIPTNSSGNFLAGDSGILTSQQLTFTDDGMGTPTATLSIPLDDDSVGERNGTIGVELRDEVLQSATLDDYSYFVSDNGGDGSATAQISDDDGGSTIPELFIEDAPPVNESVSTASFTVTANTSVTSLNVSYTPTNLSGDFLGNNNGRTFPQNLVFDQTGNTATLRVALHNDSVREATGSIMVTLVPLATYGLIEGGESATAIVYDNEAPELSISEAATGNESENAVITVNTTFNPGKNLVVGYTPTNSEGDFLGTASDVPTSATLNYGQLSSALTATFPVQFDNDMIDEEDGSIVVTLSPDTDGQIDYTVSTESGSITIDVSDNDYPELSIQGGNAVDESQMASFAVKSDRLPHSPIEVRYFPEEVGGNFLGSAAGISATATMTFALDGNSEYVSTLLVGLDDDNVRESNHSVRVTLNTDNMGDKDYEVSATEFAATVAVSDNEIPVLTIVGPGSAMENETINFTVGASYDPLVSIDVKYTATNVSGDFLGSGSGIPRSTTLTFQPLAASPLGGFSAALPLPLTNDTVDEEDGSIRVELNENLGVYEISDELNTVAVSIADNDVPELSISNASPVHENAAAVFTITSNLEAELPLVVSNTLSNISGNYLAANSGVTHNTPLTFSDNGSGQYTAQLTVELDDDDFLEADGIVGVTLNSDPALTDTYTVSSSSSATVNVMDDDAMPVISVANARASEANRELIFELNLDRTIGKTATVNYRTVDGSARDGVDFSGILNGRLTFRPGETNAKIRIRLNDETLDENDETFAVSFANPVNATFAGDSLTAEVYGTIVDDDNPPGLSIASATAMEDAGVLSFAVNLDHDSSREVRVEYETVVLSSDTSTSGTDFASRSDTLIFAVGETSKTISVTVNDDDYSEVDETFTVRLVNPVNGTILVGTATGTIENDDGATATVSFPTTTVYVDEAAGTMNVGVVLSRSVSQNVTVTIASENGTALSGSDYNLQQQQVTILMNELEGLIPVSISNDSVPEDDEEFKLRITAAQNADLSTDTTKLQTTVVIHDSDRDNKPAISILRAVESVTEGETMTFVISATKSPPVSLTINIGLSEDVGNFIDKTVAGLIFGSPTGLTTKFTLPHTYVVGTTMNFNVATVDDSIGEADGEVTATVLSGQGYKKELSGSDSSIDVYDNDWPRVSLAVGGETRVSRGEDAMFRVTVAPPPSTGTLLPVKLALFQSGDNFLVNPPGVRTVLVPSSGTYDHSESTTASMDGGSAPGGSLSGGTATVTARVVAGSGYNPHTDVTNQSAVVNVGEEAGTIITVTNVDATATEGSGLVYLTYNLTLVNPNNISNVGVDVAVTGGTATETEDYLVPSTRLEFGDRETNLAVNVTVVNDSLLENPETLTLMLTAHRAVFSDGTTTASLTGTINSEDLPVISITASDESVSDTDYIEISVSAKPTPINPIGVSLTLTDSDNVVATANTPFSFSAGEAVKTRRLTFNAGSATATTGSMVVLAVAPSVGNYIVDANTSKNTANVHVVNGSELPSVSISGDGPATEGSLAYFSVHVTDVVGQSRSAPLTVKVKTSNKSGSFLAGTPDVSVTVGIGAESGIHTVATTGDTFAGGIDGVITTELVPGRGYRLAASHADRSADVTVFDNGGATVITLLNQTGVATEGPGMVKIDFDMVLSKPSNGSVSVTFMEESNGSAVINSDFSLPSSPLNFANGIRTETLSVVVENDINDEEIETFALNLTVTGAKFIDGGNQARVTGTIIDNDQPPIVTVTSSGVREDSDANVVTFDVLLSSQSERDVELSYVIDPTSTATSNDYTIPTESVSPIRITAGNTSKSFSFTLVDDSEIEPDETIVLNLTAVNAEFSRGVNTGSVTGLILQDNDLDSRPIITISAPESVSEATGTFTLTLRANPNPAPSTSIVVTTLTGVDSPGSVGRYFGGISTNRVVINDNGVGTTTVTVVDDDTYRGWGELSFSLTATNNYRPSTDNNITKVVVEDDDVAPITVDISAPASVEEGDILNVTLTASQLPTRGKRLLVSLSVADSGSVGNYFGSFNSAAATITDDSRTTIVPVTTNEDGTYRGNGEITVTVFRGDGYEAGDPASIRIRVEDDESQPVIEPPVDRMVPSISVMIASTRILEGDSFEIVLRATPPPASGEYLPVSTLTVAEIGSVSGYLDEVSPNHVLAINPTAVAIDDTGIGSATVTTNDDSVFKQNGLIEISLSQTEDYTIASDYEPIQVTVVDDENTAFPILSVESVSLHSDQSTPVTAGDEGNVFVFQITSSQTLDADLPVAIEITQRGDFVGASASGPIEHVQTTGRIIRNMSRNATQMAVSIGTTDDTEVESDGLVALRIARGLDYRVAGVPDNFKMVSVRDNDGEEVALPVVSVGSTVGTATESEEGAMIDFDLLVSNSTGSNTTVRVTNLSGTALEMADYMVENKVLEFNNRSTLTLRVFILDDYTHEDDEEFTISITVTGGLFANETTSEELTGVIVDNDRLPRISITTNSVEVDAGSEIEFFLHTSPVSRVDLPVAIRMTQSNDFVMWKAPSVMTINRGESGTKFSIMTMENSRNIDNGTVTVEVMESLTNEYEIGTGSNLGKQFSTVLIRNVVRTASTQQVSIAHLALSKILNIGNARTNGVPIEQHGTGQIPKVSISAVEDSVEEGDIAQFQLTTEPTVEQDTLVNVNLASSSDIITAERLTVEILRGQKQAILDVQINDNDYAGEDGLVEATVLPGIGYTLTTRKTATVTVRDDADRDVMHRRVTTASQSLLPAILANTGARTMDATNLRLNAHPTSGTNSQFNFAGASSLKELVEMGGQALNGNTISLRSALGDTSFAINLFPDQEVGGMATFWGEGDYRELNRDSSLQSGSREGNTFTGQLGMDANFGQNIVAGVATSISESEVKFESDNTGSIAFEVKSQTVHPYFGLTTTGGEDWVQFNSGIGYSDIGLTGEKMQSGNLNGFIQSTGLSGNKLLYSGDSILSGGKFEVNATGTTWLGSQRVTDDSELINEFHADYNFHQLAIEGSLMHELTSGATIVPKISFGVWGEDLDGRNVGNLELISNTTYETTDGLSISGIAHTLFANSERQDSWGIAGELHFDHGGDGLGLLVDFSPGWAQKPIGESQNLWIDNTTTGNGIIGSLENGFTLDSELGYGMVVCDGCASVIPYFGLNLKENQTNEVVFGGRLKSEDFLDIGMEFTQNRGIAAPVEESLRVTGKVKW